MYVYQNGKLYSQVEDKLVGVEIYSDKIILLEDCVDEIDIDAMFLTPHEVRCKFQIETNPYIFPREIKEEVKLDGEVKAVKPVKKPSRKAISK